MSIKGRVGGSLSELLADADSSSGIGSICSHHSCSIQAMKHLSKNQIECCIVTSHILASFFYLRILVMTSWANLCFALIFLFNLIMRSDGPSQGWSSLWLDAT